MRAPAEIDEITLAIQTHFFFGRDARDDLGFIDFALVLEERNRLITVDAILTLLGTAIACAAAVGGFYGMNLRNPQADDRGGFAEVTLFTVAGCLAFLVAAVAYLFASGILVY